MKNKRSNFFFFCFAIAFSSPVPSASTPPPLPPVPAPVPKTNPVPLSGDKLGQIERDDEDGEISYTVTMTRDGKDRDFTVAENGTLLSQEVLLDETPPAVQRTIKMQMGQGTLDNIDKTFDETEINYE